MKFLGTVLVAAMFAMVGAAHAQNVGEPCKNHYILDDDCPAPPSFTIQQVFTNLDGTVQYIQLVESKGLNDQNHFKGWTLSVTSGATRRTFTFPSDLPSPLTAHASVVVAAAPVYLSGPILFSAYFGKGFSEVVTFRPDYALPSRFLAIEGGTIDFAGVDAFTYESLPTDGVTARYRDGGLRSGGLPKASCPGGPLTCPGWFVPTPELVGAVEYYDAAHDHYFMTAQADEIDVLDSGRIAGWVRTGQGLMVGAGAISHLGIEWTYGGGPVCRVYIPPEQGGSHFYSASPELCAEAVARYPGFVLETPDAFYAALPNASTGACDILPGIVDGDIALVPVYRLWNGKADTNHRFTADPAIRAEMIAKGWIPEGYGPDGVVMCTVP